MLTDTPKIFESSLMGILGEISSFGAPNTTITTPKTITRLSDRY